MAKSQELPAFEQKRKVLFGPKTAPEELREVGRRFMDKERFDDALEFFARCEAQNEVRKVAHIALERGDTSLFLRAKVVLREEATKDEFLRLAKTAEQSGKAAMAALAYRKAGDEETADRLLAEAMGLVPEKTDTEGVPDEPGQTGESESS
jgi:hypothetical protein